MNNFLQRAITGLSFAAVMIVAILFNPWSFIAIFFLISTLGLMEFYKLVKSDHTHPQVLPGVLLAQILFLLFTWLQWNHTGLEWMMIAIPMVASIFIFELYRKKEHPFQNIAITITGMIYLTLPVLLMVKIAFGLTPYDDVPYHGGVIMGCIFLVWASDTGAYMIGSKIGRHRLFERISPKKSWEGFFGGMLVALFAAWVNSIWFPVLSMSEWMIVSVIVVTTGTLGTLLNRCLKRSIGVKDSGNILPGHGGILDRFDAVLISIPFVFFYLFLIGKFS
ncbi:MAG: phosphatidate cytidylyltransferase [Bacteroidetes bacterium]|nr:phosphatidate cytidylyltransferase [Bacteroidota bacterium]